jgi:hypothetical protein
MICANPTCKKDFTPATHNQIYCSSDCCKIVTNENIKRKYHERKARLNGSERYCKCGTKLSRYNKWDTCAACDTKEKQKHDEGLARILSVIQF